jgi:hypothetical protein
MDYLKWLFIASVLAFFVWFLISVSGCGSGEPLTPDPARGGGEPYTPMPDTTRNTAPPATPPSEAGK